MLGHLCEQRSSEQLWLNAIILGMAASSFNRQSNHRIRFGWSRSMTRFPTVRMRLISFRICEYDRYPMEEGTNCHFRL